MITIFERIRASQVSSQIVVSLVLLVIALAVFMSSTVWAKNVTYRKTQEVNFDGSDVDGVVRNPDGAYLVQKRGIDFMPLYKVKQNFDDKIKESAQYMK